MKEKQNFMYSQMKCSTECPNKMKKIFCTFFDDSGKDIAQDHYSNNSLNDINLNQINPTNDSCNIKQKINNCWSQAHEKFESLICNILRNKTVKEQTLDVNCEYLLKNKTRAGKISCPNDATFNSIVFQNSPEINLKIIYIIGLIFFLIILLFLFIRHMNKKTRHNFYNVQNMRRISLEN